jgi:peroxiredoxin/uncharacterized membrane protein YphA (DoxX/SURF4 family)
MGTLVLILRLVLAGVLGTAGIAKLLDQEGSRRALGDFGVPAGAVPVVAILLPLVELATAVALIPQETARWAAVAAIVLMLAFMVGIARAMAQGRAPDCHCFGQIHSAPAGRGTLVRNGVLAGLAAIIVVYGSGPSLGSWVSDRVGSELVAVAVAVVAIFLAALAVQLWMENRSLRRELEDAEGKLALFPPGLPAGTPAPSFALKDLHGETVTLESLRAGGQHVLLVFVGASCGPCYLLLPHLRRWQATLADRLTVAIISTGSEEENQDVIEEHGIEGIFLHDGSQTLDAYRVSGTPTSVLVTPDGRIARSSIVGARTLEPLIRMTLKQWAENGAHAASATERQPVS